LDFLKPLLRELVTLPGHRWTKKPAAPSSRNVLQARFTLTKGTPKAREISLCEALPLAMSWLVKNRNEAISVTGWLKTGRCPLKYQTTESLS